MSGLESATGVKFPNALDLTEKDSVQFLLELCQKHIGKDYQYGARANPAPKLLYKLFSKMIEPELQNPTFVIDHPICMSPLAKEHRSKPGSLFLIASNASILNMDFVISHFGKMQL